MQFCCLLLSWFSGIPAAIIVVELFVYWNCYQESYFRLQRTARKIDRAWYKNDLNPNKNGVHPLYYNDDYEESKFPSDDFNNVHHYDGSTNRVEPLGDDTSNSFWYYDLHPKLKYNSYIDRRRDISNTGVDIIEDKGVQRKHINNYIMFIQRNTKGHQHKNVWSFLYRDVNDKKPGYHSTYHLDEPRVIELFGCEDTGNKDPVVVDIVDAHYALGLLCARWTDYDLRYGYGNNHAQEDAEPFIVKVIIDRRLTSLDKSSEERIIFNETSKVSLKENVF